MNLANDLKYGLRQLVKRPGFSLAVVITLALGIAAATTMFTVMKAVLLSPLPYEKAERAVMIWSSWKDFPKTWVSYDEYELYREQISAFSSVDISYSPVSAIVGGSDDPERIKATAVTAGILETLGVHPHLGRGFLAAEDAPGGGAVAVIGFDLWQRRFGGDPEIIGRMLEFNGEQRQIVGVLPAGFRMPLDYGAESRTEAMIPLAADPADWEAVRGPEFSEAGGAHTFYAFGRLANNSSLLQANAQLESLTDRLNDEGVYPSGWDFRARAISLPDQITGELRPALWVVSSGVLFLIAIACINVAGLILMRGEHRRREFGIRSALGARPQRLVRQLLVESTALAILAGLIALFISWTAVSVIRATVPGDLPRVGDAAVDMGAFLFALSAALLTALIVTIIPALRVARSDPAREVKASFVGTTGGAGVSKVQPALVAVQVMIAVVLTVGAGLMVRSVSSLLSVPTGFNDKDVLTMNLSVPSSRYPESADVGRFYRELDSRLSSIPGLEHAGAIRLLPLDGQIGDMAVQVEGFVPRPGESTAAEWQVVIPGYFEAMSIGISQGRAFEDRAASGDAEVIVNRKFVEKYFPEQEPLGRMITVGASINARIVGVIENTLHNSLLSDIKPRFYISHERVPQRSMSVVVKAGAPPEAIMAAMRREVREMDPRLAVSDVRKMSEIVESASVRPRFVMLTLSLLSSVALVLGLVGIYGVLGYYVSRSTRELGIRMSLGAAPARVFAHVLKRGISLTLVGTLIGLGIALTTTHLLEHMLVDISPGDPATYLAVLVLFVSIGAIACAIPAFRATRVKPTTALRLE